MRVCVHLCVLYVCMFEQALFSLMMGFVRVFGYSYESLMEQLSCAFFPLKF